MKNIWLRKKAMYPCKEPMEKWGKKNSRGRSMLSGLDDHAAYHMAILLENQKLFNDMAGTTGDSFLDRMMKSISISTVRRTYDPKNLLISDIVSIQSMLGPCGLLCYQENDKQVIEEAVARTRKLKTQFPVFFSFGPQEGFTKYGDMYGTAKNLYLIEEYAKNHTLGCMGLDNECDMACYMVEQRVNEITAEIITDLRNNVVSTQHLSGNSKWNDIKNILVNDFKYWAIANPKTLEFLLGPNEPLYSESLYQPYDLRKTGYLQDAVYSYEKMPENEVLIGIQEKDPNMRSYVYAPYHPLSVAGQICFDCGETHSTRWGLMTRGAKILAKDGSKFFGKIILDS